MPSYLQIENISKSYGTKVLFENIGFHVNEGDKIALIAPNGTGKTTLMRILAGKEKSDSGGSVKFLRQIRIAFLEQDYAFDPAATVLAQALADSAPYMEGTDPFEYELRVRKFLSSFHLDPEQRMDALSGGEVKRVALTVMLASEADFLIMDEPTNHLDLDAVEFLESTLKRSRCTLFMVTHDRYFLDRVCNTVMELDRGAIYIYKGDYANFLEKRSERIENWNAQTDRVRNLFRRELEWIHATPCARTGKAKYRKQAFQEIRERASQTYRETQVSMEGVAPSARLGSKIIDCHDVGFSYGDRCMLSHFTYNFQRGERVGIVGANGVGKTTFLRLLAGALAPTEGFIERGESLRIGWYDQAGMTFDEDQTVLETVNDSQLLGQFLFPYEMLNTPVRRLSGGERRRLYLLTILVRQPNLLILDEPTNDLDIMTLNVLEEYLLAFKGSLIIVSHDRHFLDRLADHLLVFCGEGRVKDFIGGYTEYHSFLEDVEAERRRAAEAARPKAEPRQRPAESRPRRLSYAERRELEQLGRELEALGAERTQLEALLSGGTADYAALTAASERYGALKEEQDAKELRWLELSELA